MTTEIIRNYFQQVFSLAYHIKIDRPLLIVKLNRDLSFSPIDDADGYDPRLFQDLNSRPKINAKAGYSSYDYARNTHDLLILGEDVLSEDGPPLFAILIHEAAHCLIETDNDKFVATDEEAKQLGKEYYNKLNPATEQETRHTEQFCILLAQGCINFVNETRYLKSPEECILSALRFEQLWLD